MQVSSLREGGNVPGNSALDQIHSRDGGVANSVDAIGGSDTARAEVGFEAVGSADDALGLGFGHGVVAEELVMLFWRLCRVTDDLHNAFGPIGPGRNPERWTAEEHGSGRGRDETACAMFLCRCQDVPGSVDVDPGAELEKGLVSLSRSNHGSIVENGQWKASGLLRPWLRECSLNGLCISDINLDEPHSLVEDLLTGRLKIQDANSSRVFAARKQMGYYPIPDKP